MNNNDCESVEVKATTGSIEVFLPEKTPASGELKSNLGGFTIELDGIQVVEEKSDMVQKNLRFNQLIQVKKLSDSMRIPKPAQSP
ncbi:hypothetical protein [Mesobacillus boroniphilus]|uniref:hypothetical protein n=1 Tax=Mesobacillus boroniphilus TaxID=308892 RepID=UPI0034E24763